MIDTGKLAPHLQGKLSQEWIDLLNWWQVPAFLFLGNAGDLNRLLDQLTYRPERVFFRLWWEHDLNYSGGVLHITPDNWQDMLKWAAETSEYLVHKSPDTGEIYRPDFPDQWNEHWEPGTNLERRCVQKWMDWVRPDLLALRGRENVFILGFLHGIKDEITERVFTFEQERAGALWYGYDGIRQHKLKALVLNFANGQYAPDQPFWYSPEFGSFAQSMKAMPWVEAGFHAYCHGSTHFEHTTCTVRDNSGLFELEPHVYVRDDTVWPASSIDTWSFFLPHHVYEAVFVPAGLGAMAINVSESGYDRPYKQGWPRMVEVYYRGKEPGGPWEYAYENADWPISHWKYLKFLDPYLNKAGNDDILAAQLFAEHDLAWASTQDDVYPEIKSRCLYQFFDPNWPNYRFDNFLSLERLAQVRLELKTGKPPEPPPPPAGGGCSPLAVLRKLFAG